jgi:hypothetical protein
MAQSKEDRLKDKDVSVPDVCPVLGIPLKVVSGKGFTDNSPSLDRIVPSLGYVPGNVVVISMRANRIKSDASLAELKKIVEFYQPYLEGECSTLSTCSQSNQSYTQSSRTDLIQ